MNVQEVLGMFDYHRPSEENVRKIQQLRQAHKVLAQLILELTPNSAEQTLALRSLHQCSMHANFALVKSDPVFA